MKVCASFSRKVGLPGYCSLGADCTVETDVPKGAGPESVAAAIRAAQAAAVAAVDELLAAQLDLHTCGRPDLLDGRGGGDGPGPEPGPDPGPARPVGRDGRALGRAATAGNGGPDHAGGGWVPDRPQDGRQLLAMVRRWAEADGIDLTPALSTWGKRHGLPWRVLDWEPESVADAAAYLATRRPEPAAVAARGRR